MRRLTGYYGTYSSPESLGIYRFSLDLDTGLPAGPELTAEARDAKCLAGDDGVLAFPVQEGRQAGILLTSSSGKVLARRLFEGVTGCYLLFDGPVLYSANYHEGTVTVLSRSSLQLLRRLEMGKNAGCHQVIPHGDLILVPCLELDEVRMFDRTRDYAPAGSLRFPPGTGPRHGVFDRDGRRFFLVSERSNQLFLYRVDGRNFTLENAVSAAPGGATAALRLSRDQRFLYVSTREADLLSVFRLDGCLADLVQQVSCGGRHPRDFDLTPDGRWLVCLNRDSGSLVSFPIDPELGTLGTPAGFLTAPHCSGILLPEHQNLTQKGESRWKPSSTSASSVFPSWAEISP